MIMGLRHLRCFLAIAEEGTLTRAAARLHLTQPVVSRTLRQLEDHLLTRGDVDAALLRGPVTAPGIRTEPLMTEPRLAAVPAGTPLAARPQLASAAGLTLFLAWAHPPTHPAVAKLAAVAREVIAYRPPGPA